jgi:hypothetical protein
MNQIFGLKYGTAGSISRQDGLILTIESDSVNIIRVFIGREVLALLVLRIDGIVDLVDPAGKWIIPIGSVDPFTKTFCSEFPLEVIIHVASFANKANSAR